MGRFDLVLPHLVDILIKTVSQQSRLDMGVIFGHKRYAAFRLLNKLLSAEVNDVFCTSLLHLSSRVLESKIGDSLTDDLFKPLKAKTQFQLIKGSVL